MKCGLKIFSTSLLLCFSASLFAGGPFMIDDVNKTGQPRRWKQNTIFWKVDQGRLSKAIDHDTGVAWIKDLFATWQNASLLDAKKELRKTVKLEVRFRGTVGEDITAENISQYTDGDLIGTQNALLVFDEDGAIMEKLGHDKNSIIGLGAPLEMDASGLYIKTGIVILNGRMIDKEPGSDDNNEVSERAFKAAITHEIGHVLNLDHCQVNSEVEDSCKLGGSCMEDESICTMYPELKTEMQDHLHRDDVVAISFLYPAENYAKYFGTIKGSILDVNGDGMQGVNVVARSQDSVSRHIDARAMVSGVLYPAGTKNGSYILGGCLPGTEYEVYYEPLNSTYKGPSGFEPLDNPPQNFVKASIVGSDGTYKIKFPESNADGTLSADNNTVVLADVKTSMIVEDLSGRETSLYGTDEPKKRPTMCSFNRIQESEFRIQNKIILDPVFWILYSLLGWYVFRRFAKF